MTVHPPAPELAVSQWFNTDTELNLADLRGEVVVIEAFQMLCPGCVSHGLPQAHAISPRFVHALTVPGLHTVFDPHAAMPPTSIEAFLHEYRITFPVGVDQAEPGNTMPITMRRYQLPGTPSLLAICCVGILLKSSSMPAITSTFITVKRGDRSKLNTRRSFHNW